MLPEAGQGALALQVRAGEEELVSPPSATTRRAGEVEAERACAAAIGAGCLAPVAVHHDGVSLPAMIAAEDGSWLEHAHGDDPAALAAELMAAAALQGRMRVIVTRPRAQAGPLVERLEALGFEVVECPLIEIERTSDEPIDCAGYEWLIVTSPNGADEIARRGTNLPKIAAVGPGTAETLRAHGIEPDFVPRVSSQDGLLAEFPRPEGRVLFAAAENSRRGPIDELGADFVPLYRTRLALARARRPATSSSSRPARRRARTRGSAAAAPAVTIGPETTRIARSEGLTVRRGGRDPRPRRPGRGRREGRQPDVRHDHLPHRLRAPGRLRRRLPGVIKRIARDVEIIDITHGIPPQAVTQGALVLARSVPYMPVGVHLAVVDPGVGGDRRAVAIRTTDGRVYVGPDNGLLSLAAPAGAVVAVRAR